MALLPTMVEANGAQLYYELQGSGPALLLIPGAEGDAEEYARVARAVAETNSPSSHTIAGPIRAARGPRVTTGTSVEQQADDAAALLEAIGLAPGDRLGQQFWGHHRARLGPPAPGGSHRGHAARAAALRRDEDVGKVLDSLKRATVNGKVPFLQGLTGDDIYDGFRKTTRTLAADRTWIDVEFDVFEYYRPLDEELARVSTPVAGTVRVGEPALFHGGGHLAGRKAGNERRGHPRQPRRALLTSRRSGQGCQSLCRGLLAAWRNAR